MTMELSKTSYEGLIIMPANRVREYLDWKCKFDKELAKKKEEEMENLRV